MELTTILLAIVTIVVVLVVDQRRRRQAARLPPGPWGIPLLGCLPFAEPNLHRYFARLSETYGPILSLRFGTKLHVAITSPALAMKIYKTHDAIFANHDIPSVALRFTAAPNILFAPYGPYWRVLRKVAVHHVLSPSVINSLQQLRRQEFRRVLSKLQSSIGTPVDFRETTFSVLISVLFGMLWEDARKEGKGLDLGNQLLEIFDCIAATTDFFNIADYFPILAPLDLQGLYKKMAVMSKRLDGILDSIIKQKLSNPSKNTDGVGDFLQIMLDLVEKKDPDVPIDIPQVKTLMTEVLFSGTDSTTATVEWAMTELMQHPSVMGKLQEELDAVVGKGSEVEESHLPKLEYLSALVKETMRLHVPMPLLVPRYSTETVEVGGYTIPKGTTVLVNAWAIQRDPTVWERPLEFLPERFLEQPDRWDFHGKSFEFMPFGGGRRTCPGMNLAEKMMMYTLGSLVHGFRWELPVGTTAINVDDKFGIALKKKDPLLLVPLPR